MSARTFVGRERELSDVARLLTTARTGRGAVVLLDGEPGMGKTTLADEVVREARADGWACAWGGCLEGGQAPAYWPWIKILRDLGDAAQPLVEQASGDDAGSRFRLFEEVIAVLRRSADRGLLVVLDDLHWADVASARLLQVLAAEIGEQPIVVLGCYRGSDVTGSEVGEVLSAIARERACTRIVLNGLGSAELAHLAATALDQAPPTWLLRTVTHRTEGNPFFALELLRLARDTAGPEPALPQSVREVIGHRLRSVSPATRKLLRAASVLGRDFTAGALADLVDTQPDEVLGLLDEACARSLVVVGTGHRMRFAHALTREVAYADLPIAERQRLHQRAADALSTDDDAMIDALAHHLRQVAGAGSARRALDATLRAARRARNQFAYEHAAFQFRQALDLLPLLPDAPVPRHELLLDLGECQFRSGAVSDAWASCREAAELGLAAGDAAVIADAATVIRGVSNPSVDPVCDEINALCRQTLPLLGADDPVREARVLAQQTITADAFTSRGSPDLSQRALRLAESAGDPDALFMALQARQVQLVHPRFLLERLAIGERAVQLGEHTGRDDYQAWGRIWQLDAFWELGRRVQLERELAEFASLVTRMKEPLQLWRLSMIKACLAEMRGQFAKARALADEALLIGRRNGHEGANLVHLIVRARVATLTGDGAGEAENAVRAFADSGPPGVESWLGVQLLSMGKLDEARACLRAVEPHIGSFPRHTPEWIPAMAGTGELCARVGTADLAAILYGNLLPFADRQVVAGGLTGTEGPVARFLGMLAVQLGDFAAAQNHLEAAAASTVAMGSPPYEALTRLEIARLMLARRGPGDARAAGEQLDLALAGARQLGMRPLEREATQLQAEHRKDGQSPLSRRETELAGLVCEGLSNREIAKRLYLSERTVESHVRNILTKLGLERRTQIASWTAARTKN